MNDFLSTFLNDYFLDYLLMLGLVVCILTDHYITNLVRRFYLVCIAMILQLMLAEIFTKVLDTYSYTSFLHTFSAFMLYTTRPFLIFLMRMLFIQKKSKYWLIILPTVNMLVYSVGLFIPITFTYTVDNEYVNGPLGYLSHITTGVLLFIFILDSIPVIRRSTKTSRFLYCLCFIPIVLSAITDMVLPHSLGLLFHAIVFGSLFYYLVLHITFVRSHEREILEKSQTKIMLSQIQPHFLYNSLVTIQALCRKDPELASQTIGEFSSYLRQNMDNIYQTNPVPFTKEIEHTKRYASIEKLRFPNINMIYELEDVDFNIPSLSIQPLVENAIRHGVRIREQGIIRIHSYFKNNSHIVTVEDNGVGFNCNILNDSNYGQQHIGINNVKSRIELMSKGSFEITSAPDEGTTITIIIPEN